MMFFGFEMPFLLQKLCQNQKFPTGVTEVAEFSLCLIWSISFPLKMNQDYFLSPMKAKFEGKKIKIIRTKCRGKHNIIVSSKLHMRCLQLKNCVMTEKCLSYVRCLVISSRNERKDDSSGCLIRLGQVLAYIQRGNNLFKIENHTN